MRKVPVNPLITLPQATIRARAILAKYAPYAMRGQAVNVLPEDIGNLCEFVNSIARLINETNT